MIEYYAKFDQYQIVNAKLHLRNVLRREKVKPGFAFSVFCKVC